MNDVFICDFVRTPFGRYGGALASIRTDDLGALPIQALLARHPTLDWDMLDEVIYGCANQAGEDNRNVARMASLLAGLPETIPALTINRLCGSGMDALIQASRNIKAGEADLIIAGGVESMSRAPLVMPKAEAAFSRDTRIYDTTLGWRFVNPLMQKLYGTDSMAETAENVATQFNISRADQDHFALRSQQRAGLAIANGRLAREIIPVPVKRGKAADLLITQDEHPRPSTSYEGLAQLKALFRDPGCITAGNASGLNDGAAALLVASAAAVHKFGLQPIVRVLGGCSVGLAPRIMGYGPALATRKLCTRLGLTPTDFDLFEFNEAFAAQVLACSRALGLPDDADYLNPNGGAIALGHPLGASGVRISGSLALQLRQSGLHRGLASMCVGVGQGVAVGLELVQ
ncbi:MAG: 3-oxoadipyl-CoA thiolase [Pseudomonadales bacterium]|nr:3-oxoadipyl-CoA thiolase [Pseudomonadales bacterium]